MRAGSSCCRRGRCTCRPHRCASSVLERLRAMADGAMKPDSVHIVTSDEMAAAARDADVLLCLLHDTIDKRAIDAGTKLRGVCSMKITPSAVDLAAATARKIPVTVIPPIVGEATADLHMGLLTAVARRMLEGDQALRAGIFPGGQSMRFEGAG